MSSNQNIFQSIAETMYRISTDEQIREALQAREEELRVQRTIAMEIEEQQEKIAEQNATIIKLNATITEQDKEIKQLRAEIATLKES